MIRYLLSTFLLFSCVSQTNNDKKRIWEVTNVARMKFSHSTVEDGKVSGTGILTTTQRLTHTITFMPVDKPRDFSVWTCGREVFFDSVSAKIDYKYQPTHEIEMNSVCPLFAYSIAENGRKELAIINFKAKDDNLKMRVYCNGESIDATGAWLCQMRSGLTMAIKAFEFIDVEPSKNCRPPKKTGLRQFEILVEKDFCTYTFFGKDTKQFFVLTNRGYTRDD